MFQNKFPEKDRFDDYSIEIGNRVFELQILISRFISDLIKEFSSETALIDAVVPVQTSEGFDMKKVSSVYYDSASDNIIVSIEGEERPSYFSEMDLCSQHIIADLVHMSYKSEKIYKNFSDKNDVH